MAIDDDKRNAAADPILLSLFQNRFMSIAESMGRALRQTSISTNIKERLDFSCALFAPDGDLVANAPFIPIHLGAMSFAVKFQTKLHAGNLKPGDVYMANSPRAGGSHLPDITLITPVFHPDDPSQIIFFTASRAHHADIGGILPGSMPPTSTRLEEEGAEIVSFRIVRDGIFDSKGLHELMVERPAKVEGSSGCRKLSDVESDLKAQISANHKGSTLLHALIKEYTLPVVHDYMAFIRQNAAHSVRSLLKKIAQDRGTVLQAVDYLDDGSPIHLRIDINPEDGTATFDFEGTGPEIRGNLNAPPAVTHSAIIYSVRSLLSFHAEDVEIPLNAGCLVPLTIKIPTSSFLNPSRSAAVCAGNVLTSQRLVDVILKAFGACAASQGCTNNLTFGVGGKEKDGKVVKGWGYYETVAGGSGAGPNFHGTSGVHTHITNTRIGDVEILERRYPLLVHEFGLREGSGGDGMWKGGDGVVRDIEWREEGGLQVSILSERRTRAPYGMNGGRPGQRGMNIWVKQPRDEDEDEDKKAGERRVNIGGKATVWMGEGDRLILYTPGGGGWGKSKDVQADSDETESD